jgi:hypothetical protein
MPLKPILSDLGSPARSLKPLPAASGGALCIYTSKEKNKIKYELS